MPTTPRPHPAPARPSAHLDLRSAVSPGPLLAAGLLVALSLAPRQASAAPTCVAVEDARITRVGEHTLLLKTELLREKDKVDLRVKTLVAHVIDEDTAKRRVVRVPVGALRSSLAGAVPSRTLDRSNKRGARFDRFFLTVAHVDKASVTLQVRARDRTLGSRTTFATWTPGAKAFALSAPILESKPKVREYAVIAGGDANSGLIVVTARRLDDAGDKRRLALRVLRVKGAKVAEIAAFTTPSRANRRLSVGKHMRLSRDRRLLAIPEYSEAPGGDAEVHIVDLQTGKRASLPAMATIYGVDFSPDGKRLALGSNREGKIQVWDWAGKKLRKTGKGPKRLHRLVFGQGGKRLYAAGKGGKLQAYDAGTLKKKGRATRPGGKGAGALYAQIRPRPSSSAQTFGYTKDKHGFGGIARLCVGVALP